MFRHFVTNNIYRFRIKGMRDPDIEFDLSSLQTFYRIAEVIDDTEPDYDFSALFAEHSSDMIGFFIQALQNDDTIGDVLKRLPNDYSVVSSSSASWGNTASLGMVTFVSEVSFLLSDVSVLTRSLSVTIL